jgi:hypothetical protein
MLLAYIEPANSKDKDFFEHNEAYFLPLFIAETVILLIFFFECWMEIYHRSFDKIRDFKVRYTSNVKLMAKIVTIVVFLIDFIIFYSNPESLTFRFGRILRPGKLDLIYSSLSLLGTIPKTAPQNGPGHNKVNVGDV